METVENKISRHEAIARWLQIIEGDPSLEQPELEFPDLFDVLTESEVLNIRIALLDGWTELKLFNKTSSRTQLIGYNESLASQYGIHIPNYVTSVDAIAGALARISASYDVGRYEASPQYKAMSLVDRHLRSFQGDTMAIALCKLYLAIAPSAPKPKPLIGVLDLKPEVFEVEFA